MPCRKNSTSPSSIILSLNCSVIRAFGAGSDSGGLSRACVSAVACSMVVLIRLDLAFVANDTFELRVLLLLVFLDKRSMMSNLDVAENGYEYSLLKLYLRVRHLLARVPYCFATRAWLTTDGIATYFPLMASVASPQLRSTRYTLPRTRVLCCGAHCLHSNRQVTQNFVR